MVNERDFDLVLMDLQMPEVSGFDATTAILNREWAQGRVPPKIVAITASTSDEDKQRCKEVGMVGHLAKPIQQDEGMSNA
jgi:CheY-like chemotaxis protein